MANFETECLNVTYLLLTFCAIYCDICRQGSDGPFYFNEGIGCT